MTAAKIPTVHEAWLAVMGDVGAINKDQTAGSGNFKYNFRGVEKTVNAVQPVLIQHKVTMIPVGMSYDTYEFINGKGNREEQARVTVDWVVTGPAGDSFTLQSIGAASDTSDKAVIQATSVAQRVGLLVGLQIPTNVDDEPDQHQTDRADTAAADEAAKAGGWQDAAQRDAVWTAVLGTAQALPQETHDAIVLPWAKANKLDPASFTVTQSEEWKQKIKEAEGSVALNEHPPAESEAETPPPSSPAASPQEPDPAGTIAATSAPSDGFDAEKAYGELNEQMRKLGSKDAQKIEAWLEEQKILSPVELTKALAAGWFAMLSDCLGAAVSEPVEGARPWKTKAEMKRTFESLLERQSNLPDELAHDVILWGKENGVKQELDPQVAIDWQAKIIEAEMEAPF